MNSDGQCCRESVCKWWVAVQGLNHNEVRTISEKVSSDWRRGGHVTTDLISDWWTGAGAARARQREGQAGGVQRADLAGAQRAGGHGLQGRASNELSQRFQNHR